MTITHEQVANLIFATSQLRWFEKELMSDKNNLELNDICTKWQFMVDKVLTEMGMEGFIAREQLIKTLKFEYAH